ACEMLERLTLSELALVERAEVEFGPGLNVISGETGAGKSLLVESMSLLVGERAPADVVREGARAAWVEGEFRLAGDSARREAEALAGLREAGSDLERLEHSLLTLADRRGWMAEALREIDAANLREGEEETLRRETARLAHTDRLRELVSQALQRLSETPGAALEGLHSAAPAV